MTTTPNQEGLPKPKVGDVFLTRAVNELRMDDRILSRIINDILAVKDGAAVYCLNDVYVHGNDIKILSADQCMGKMLFTVTISEELTATKQWKEGEMWKLKQDYFL